MKSPEHFIRTVKGQNNLWNIILFQFVAGGSNSDFIHWTIKVPIGTNNCDVSRNQQEQVTKKNIAMVLQKLIDNEQNNNFAEL